MKSDFQTIIKDHNDILYKISKSFAFANYKDLYQEIAIQLWKSLKHFKGECQVKTWVYRVAFNTAVTYKSKSNSYTLKNLPLDFDMPNISEGKSQYNKVDNSSIEKKKKVNLLYKCINMLKPINRSIIILQLEGHDYEEISQITGLNVNSIGVKLNRIRKSLFRLLKENGYERI